MHQYPISAHPDANEPPQTKARYPLPWPQIVCQSPRKMLRSNINLQGEIMVGVKLKGYLNHIADQKA